MKTPATRFLDALHIEYAEHAYEHDPNAASFGLEAADALGLGPEVVFKTLLARLGEPGGKRELVVAIVPVANKLDLKALARAAGAKRADMASVADAERVTGYVAGGISPFGQRKRLATFIDETAELVDRIYVSGGQRGLDIGLAPADLIGALDATVAPLAT